MKTIAMNPKELRQVQATASLSSPDPNGNVEGGKEGSVEPKTSRKGSLDPSYVPLFSKVSSRHNAKEIDMLRDSYGLPMKITGETVPRKPYLST